MGNHSNRYNYHVILRRASRVAFLAVLIGLLFSPPANSRLNPYNITIEGTFGFGGYYRTRTPTPINLRIENYGEAFEGWALADLQGWVPPTYYTRPLVIPGGTEQRIEIGCYGCWQTAPCEAPVSLLTSNGDPIAETLLTSRQVLWSDTLLVHLGQPDYPLGSLFEGTNPGFLIMAEHGLHPSSGLIDYSPRIFPVAVDPADLPTNSLLMDSVSVVVTGLQTYLSLDQSTRDMLQEYVLHGGNLLVYYRDGIDPVDGWESEPLLPVTSDSEVRTIPIESFLDTCNEILPLEALQSGLPPRATELGRAITGEVIIPPPLIPGAEENPNSVGGGPDEDYQDVQDEFSPSWNQPENYRAVAVTPNVQCETVHIDGSDSPILAVRNLGSGHAGFSAFDPFKGSPTASDPPIGLLATYGLLDPNSPSRQFVSESGQLYHSLNDARVQGFFRQGSISGSGRVMKWLDALGPALIYLLVLPIIVILARGRGNMILALFVLWSVIFTGITLYRRSAPVDDRVMINEASLYWCEALSGEESSANAALSTRLYTFLSYHATTSATRNVSWDHPDALLDEMVDTYTWPYGSVTIESGQSTRLPDLPIETIPYQPTASSERAFILRRVAPELTASGELIVSPDHARLILDAELPFPAAECRLLVTTHDLWIAKHLGPQPEILNLDFDLEEGAEIIRRESLFPDYEGEIAADRRGIESEDEQPEEDIGYTLKRYWMHAINTPVGRAQAYTESRITGRPTRAFLTLASTGVPSGISLDHGELERHAVTVIVISIPIVYEDSPLNDLN